MHPEGCGSAFGRCDESLIEILDRYVHSEGCYSAYGRCDESPIETLDRYAHSEGCYSSFGRCDEPLIETLDRYVHIKGYYCAFGRCGESLIETLNEYREPPDRTPRAATPPSAAAMSPCSNFGPLGTFRGLLLGLRPLRLLLKHPIQGGHNFAKS